MSELELLELFFLLAIILMLLAIIVFREADHLLVKLIGTFFIGAGFFSW